MKKAFIKISVLSIAIIALATSCTKTGATGPAGSNGGTGATGATGGIGPNLTGTLQGVVFLYAVDGTKILSSTTQAGDSVILTNNGSGAVVKTVTSSTGSYTFTNVTTGTYSLTLTKPGYGTVLSPGVQFAGGGIDYRNYALSQVPTTSVTAALAVDTSYGTTPENYVKVRGYVPVSAGETTVIFYVSIPSNTSVNGTPGNFSASYTTTIAPGTTKFSLSIPTNSLYDLGFVIGNTVYISAYIVGGATSASSYADVTTGQTVYTALSSTAVNTSAAVQ